MNYHSVCMKTHALDLACNTLVYETDMDDEDYSFLHAKNMLRGHVSLYIELAKAANAKKDEVLANLNRILLDKDLVELGCEDLIEAYLKE